MTRITEVSERVFLSRAEAVTEKKRMHAAHYEQQLQGLIAQLQRGDVSKVMQILKTTKKGFLVKEDPSSIYERYTPARIQPAGC